MAFFKPYPFMALKVSTANVAVSKTFNAYLELTCESADSCQALRVLCLTSSNKCIATRNKCIASSNTCLTSSNKKLIVSNSFLLLLVRHLLLEAMHLFLVAYCF